MRNQVRFQYTYPKRLGEIHKEKKEKTSPWRRNKETNKITRT